ncbi:hypothetical protein PUMCH_003388 [Australozyma saopauloensis]|uniref:Nucleoporin SEH1 n=1 Tax=Australozyma saopauloensis TaxID=291208 RepID=A0AAX4HBY6_9ASCO|nr:hypothetical protein PUMCH_003388 [[Candida] saopauloensis]
MRAFQTGHEELIHDIKYDLYGRYVATASSDQHIKVFDLDPASSTWVLNDLWKAHDLLVVKLSWAHPEFSSAKLLASCSYDRTVKLWQELPDELHGLGRRWMKLATLAVELYGPIYDVQFAPAHLGLKLACVGLDGIVRMYELVEPADLSVWSLTAEIPILSLQLPAKNLQSSFCIEWCPSKFAKFEKFAVIALDQGFIYSTVKRGAQTLEPGFPGGSTDIPGMDLAAADNTYLLDHLPQSDAGSAIGEARTESSLQTSYVKVCNLPEHNGLIRSISWAPSMGKSYHLIATGCKDGLIQIFKAYEQENGELKIETVARLNDHRQEVWRVEWNSTGTILSSAGDDGKVRLWKCTYMNEWKCMSVINSSNRLDDRIVDGEESRGFSQRPSITKSTKG